MQRGLKGFQLSEEERKGSPTMRFFGKGCMQTSEAENAVVTTYVVQLVQEHFFKA